MLRKDFIISKIEIMESDLDKLAEFKGYKIYEIARDFHKLFVVERALERIIMRGIDINEHIISNLASNLEDKPDSYKKTFLFLPKFGVYPEEFAEKIAPSANLRNALVHQYDDLNIGDVYISIGEAIEQYHQYCEYILKFIETIKS